MRVINTDILINPLNWLILFFMVFIAGIALQLVLSHVQLKGFIADGVTNWSAQSGSLSGQPVAG